MVKVCMGNQHNFAGGFSNYNHRGGSEVPRRTVGVLNTDGLGLIAHGDQYLKPLIIHVF